MTKVVRGLMLAAALLVPTTAANAAIIHLATPLGLTGSQENPPRATPATGYGEAFLDTVAFTLQVDLSWQGLLAAPGAAHIHCCSGPGVNAPVAVDFVPFAFPNTTSGSFSHLFDLNSATVYGGGFLSSFGGNVAAARDAVITGLLTNKAYFNIHTSVYPGGEIRGDISTIPEPATLTLVALGLGSAVLRRRRARRE